MLKAAQAQNSVTQPQLRAAYSSLRLQSRATQVSKWKWNLESQDSGVDVLVSDGSIVGTVKRVLDKIF